MDKQTAFYPWQNFKNFGRSLQAPSYAVKPQDAAQIEEIFRVAKAQGLTVSTRGAGRSYNDAALNGGGILLDMTGMNRILAWNAETGVVTAEAGVNLQALWQRVLPDGWWPPVVSGTMFTTLGGCLGANVHGKNNFKMGTIGEHVLEFSVLLPTGALLSCSPNKNGDLFHAMIGGLGMLGVFTSITLQMKKMHSGHVRVSAYPVKSLAEQLAALQAGAPEHDYIVGWLDATAGGSGLGRGQIHAADYLHEEDQPGLQKSMQVDYQTQPATMFGFFPKSAMHYFMSPFMNNLGVRAVNMAKYIASLRHGEYHQTHAGFHFLLDYVPNWDLAYGKGGLIQYQSFLPKETALAAWTEMLTLSRRKGLFSYLGVTKRHRPDAFLLSHSLDGFSLALDFKVTAGNRLGLRTMLQEFDQIVLAAGGRFYFAKNSETTSESALRFLGADTVSRFQALKKRCDPHHLLESNLYRRIFGGL